MAQTRLPGSLPVNEVDLQAFLEGAGNSLTGAQRALGAEINLQTDLVIANAELEAKVALKSDATGRLSVQPISLQELQQSSLSADAISTVRVSFVATAREITPNAPATGPTRKPAEVIEDVRQRPDIANLQEILGELSIETTFVPQTNRWLVTARDPNGRLVREVILPDELL